MNDLSARLFNQIRRLVDEAYEYDDYGYERLYLGRAIIDVHQMFLASLEPHEVAEALSADDWRFVASLVRSEMRMWLAMLEQGDHNAAIYELLFDSVYNDYLSPLRNPTITDDKIGEDLDILRKATARCRDYLVTVGQILAIELQIHFDEEKLERLEMLLGNDSYECAAAAGIQPDEVGLTAEEVAAFQQKGLELANAAIEQIRAQKQDITN